MCGGVGGGVDVASIKRAGARATSKHPVVPRSAPTRESVAQRQPHLALGPTIPT